MRLGAFYPIVLFFALLSGCATESEVPAAGSPVALESVFSGVDEGSCEKQIDPEDPNQLTYLVCAGPSGYSLIARRAGSGRHSVDIVDPSKNVSPLNFQEVITRSMSNVTGKAEWRVATKDGKPVPVALIVRVQAREDANDPETVTSTYLAIAKISTSETCVIDRIPETSMPEAEWRKVADDAPQRPCLSPQPPMVADGAPIR